MSPSPSMPKLLAANPFSRMSMGNITGGRRRELTVSTDSHSHFIGASNDLATVTMTSVPNTCRED